MWVSIDLCLIPIGAGLSITPFVAACQEVIKKDGLKHELHPNGTSIEGNWEDVFACVKKCHEKVHNLGAVRIYSTIKVNTRTDRKQSFDEKVPKVLESLAKNKN